MLSYEGEHELCSIALRSSNSSIFQYINAEDVFIIFHFDKDRKYCFARRSIYNNFRKRVMEGEVCPEEDINTVISFLDGQMNEPFRTRVYTKDKAVIWDQVSGKPIVEDGEVVRSLPAYRMLRKRCLKSSVSRCLRAVTR